MMHLTLVVLVRILGGKLIASVVYCKVQALLLFRFFVLKPSHKKGAASSEAYMIQLAISLVQSIYFNAGQWGTYPNHPERREASRTDLVIRVYFAYSMSLILFDTFQKTKYVPCRSF